MGLMADGSGLFMGREKRLCLEFVEDEVVLGINQIF